MRKTGKVRPNRYISSFYRERIRVRQPTFNYAFAILATSIAVASCGGGGSTSSTPPSPPPRDLGTAEGLWNGTTGSGRSFSGLVLDNGTYWFLYTAVGNNAVLGGAIQGASTSSSGSFTSSNGMDFNLEGLGINDFTLSGTYTAKSQLGGTLTYTGGTTNTFTSSYDTDYDLTPSLATIVGTYSGEAVTVDSTNPEAATVTIASGGAITGSSAGGCSFTGTASTHAKGNVYDVSVTFGGGVCTNGTSTVTGVAYYIATQKELVSTALNSGRTNGFLFLGTKP
jgi:hypothetical protein